VLVHRRLAASFNSGDRADAFPCLQDSKGSVIT
jgi:hypothetical protein